MKNSISKHIYKEDECLTLASYKMEVTSPVPGPHSTPVGGGNAPKVVFTDQHHRQETEDDADNQVLARCLTSRHSMMAEDSGGTFFKFSLSFPSFSPPHVAIETWQDSHPR